MSDTPPLPSSQELARDLSDAQRRLDRLQGLAEERVRGHREACRLLRESEEFLEVAQNAKGLMERLTASLFGEILEKVEENLSHALREILGQERAVKSRRETKDNRLHVTLYVEGPEGEEENILAGQGGSVCNILSVGLRCIALSRLDPAQHRPFLVLDEQDCWLKPALVPVFMKTIARIAEVLGLQVLIISHHPVDLFAMHARRVLELRPMKDGGPKIHVLRDAPPDAGAEESWDTLEQSLPD